MNDSVTKPNRYSHPGKAGRKPNLSTQANRALSMIDGRLPDIIQALIKRATEGDRDAQIYLIDRRLGRPKQETDLRVKGIIAFTPEDYELLTRPKAEEAKLISQYSGEKDAIKQSKE